MVAHTAVVPIGPADDAGAEGAEAAEAPRKAKSVQVPFFKGRGKDVAVSLAMMRSNHFGLMAAIVLILGLVWCGIRFYLMIDGENQVSEAAFTKLAQSIGSTIRQRVNQDLIYQDMVANMWAMRPALTRAEFRDLILSDAYAPGLEAMTGMSLIPRVLGDAERAALESRPDSELLRQRCCGNAEDTGASCATVAATGLFCNGEQRYQLTQFGPNGLEPAVGNTTEYIDRVGAEEYMVVDMIEPFETNSRVWGFNLLSNEARNQAWKRAKATGQKTFTRRLQLVQSSVREFGFLVWLPVFKEATGRWCTALDGDLAGLTPVGSVNGVYRAQQLLTAAIESTYSAGQLDEVSIFLYDAAEELGGATQFLGAYNTKSSDAFDEYGSLSADEVIKGTKNVWMAQQIPVELRSADAQWRVLVIASDSYLSQRRTNNPTYGLVISAAMLVVGALERWLGHPALLLERSKDFVEAALSPEDSQP